MNRTSEPLWRPSRRGVFFFAAAPDRPRERSGSDLLFLVASLLTGLLLAVVAVPPSGFEAAVMGVVEEVPSALGVLWRLAVAALMLWVLTIILTAALRRRGQVLVDALATSAVGIVTACLAVRWLS